jgi:hypothetical protein
MQCARTILSSVACPALQYFSTLSHKLCDFLRKLLNTKCVFWFSLPLLSVTFLIIRRNERDIIKIYVGLHVKYHLFVSDFNETWILLSEFRKILKCQISWKSVQWEPSCSMRKDGRADRRTYMKLIVTFRSFGNAPKTHFMYSYPWQLWNDYANSYGNAVWFSDLLFLIVSVLTHHWLDQLQRQHRRSERILPIINHKLQHIAKR